MTELGTRRGPYKNRHPAADEIDAMAVQGIAWRDIWQSLAEKHPGIKPEYVKNRAALGRYEARLRGELEPMGRGVDVFVRAHNRAGYKPGNVTSALNASSVDFARWIYGQTSGGRLTVADALIKIAMQEYQRQAGTPTGNM